MVISKDIVNMTSQHYVRIIGLRISCLAFGGIDWSSSVLYLVPTVALRFAICRPDGVSLTHNQRSRSLKLEHQ